MPPPCANPSTSIGLRKSAAIQNVAGLANLATVLESRLHTIRATHDERQTHLADLHLQRDTLQAQLTERRQSHDSIQSQIEACQDNVRAAESRLPPFVKNRPASRSSNATWTPARRAPTNASPS